ncbi:MAG TPA: PIG-L family deacetylase [Symbiobacteriaceae bacterium]|nr:PIG-L family deacetylase [Symbiobacteriaceae bacterium]
MRKQVWAVAGLLVAISSWSYFFPKAPRLGPLAQVEGAPRSTVVFVPHSDDEVLAAGGLLAELESRGAQPRVVLATAGDGYKVGAEVFHRGRVPPDRMLSYGRHRLDESQQALSKLGIPAERFTFLGFPDQGLHRLWLECWQPDRPCTSQTTQVKSVPYSEARRPGAPYAGRELLGEIEDVLRETRPKVVVIPHPNEAHVDHWALSNFVTAALEELRRTEPDWEPPEEWLYLVHRGDWPAPKGYLPAATLVPPLGLTGGMTVWRKQDLTPEQVKLKEEALRTYRSQTMMMKRYLLSFVRTNELFGTIDRVKLTGGAEPYQSFTDERPPWNDLNWAEPITDPRGDTVARELERGADATGVWIARDSGMLQIAVHMAARPRRPVEVRFYARGFRTGDGWGDLTGVRVDPDGTFRLDAFPTTAGRDRVKAEIQGTWVRVLLPLAALNYPDTVMINVETRADDVLVDRTAWRPVSLDGR